jgi:hypothetical protein
MSKFAGGCLGVFWPSGAPSNGGLPLHKLPTLLRLGVYGCIRRAELHGCYDR